MSAKYERLPTTPEPPSPPSSRSPSPPLVIFPPPRSPSRMARERELNRELQRQTDRDPRFNVPPPSAWKRIGLLLFIAFLFWFGFYVRPQPRSKVVHAHRYVTPLLLVPAASILSFRSLHPFSLLFHLFPPSCAHTTVSFLLVTCYRQTVL